MKSYCCFFIYIFRIAFYNIYELNFILISLFKNISTIKYRKNSTELLYIMNF